MSTHADAAMTAEAVAVAVAVRWGWLRAMYLYTAAGAGLLGAAMLAAPGWVAGLLGLPARDPVMFGLVGSAYVAFGLLALLGLRWPLRFLPVLLLQLVYKAAWLAAVFLPLALSGQAPSQVWTIAAIFASYFVGDLIAIPFRKLFTE